MTNKDKKDIDLSKLFRYNHSYPGPRMPIDAEFRQPNNPTAMDNRNRKRAFR